jgi:CheY-like chemotaxis protein
MTAVPTVYFIDDSATMREVIKIAFRRENINVVACHDAAQALGEIEKNRPDIVITDVIMPDKDGYDVCQFIKSHPQLSKTPVVLMSGVVNRAVAEKAFAVRADELLRKPFQPQDLIARVKHLLKPNGAPATAPAPPANAAAALSNIFSAAPMPPRAATAMGGSAFAAAAGSAPAPAIASAAQPAPAFATSSAPIPAPASVMPTASTAAPPPVAVPAPATVSAPVAPASATPQIAAAKPANGNNEVNRLKIEIMRLEGLVKKLQSELQAEREYAQSLEAHMRTLQESVR